MPYVILFILFFLVNNSCAGTSPLLNENSSFEEAVEIKIFDGITLKGVGISDGKLRTVQSVSKGYYGVIFFTKKGFYPENILFKSTGKPLKMDVVPLKKLKYTDTGILTGVVYTPVRGGKIRKHRGVSRVFKDEEIEIIKDLHAFTSITDENGVFTAPLPPGQYSIRMDGKEKGEIEIEAGKTTIKNLQKGMVLAD